MFPVQQKSAAQTIASLKPSLISALAEKAVILEQLEAVNQKIATLRGASQTLDLGERAAADAKADADRVAAEKAAAEKAAADARANAPANTSAEATPAA